MKSAGCSFSHPLTPLGPRGSSRQGRGKLVTNASNIAVTAVLVAVAGICVPQNGACGDISGVAHFGSMVDNEGDAHTCLSCHDGIAVKGVDYQLFGRTSHMSALGSHPVEVPYPAEWSGRSTFASPTEIMQSGLRLFDGRVTCGTCHDLRLQQRKYYIPIPMDDSALCLTCHRI